MSKSSSPWSMVGMLMGAPKLRQSSQSKRARTAEKTTSQTVSGLVTGFFGSLETVGGPARPKPTSKNGLTNDILSWSMDPIDSSEITFQPPAAREQESGWTTVAAERASTPSELLPQRNDTSGLDEDVFDVLSQSVSTDFLHESISDDETNYNGFAQLEITKTVEAGKLDKQEVDVLAEMKRRMHDIVDESYKQAQKIQLLKTTIQSLEKEEGKAKEAERLAKKDVRESLEKIRGLDEVRQGQTVELKKIKADLELARKEQGELSKRVEESEKRARGLEERNVQLQDVIQKGKKELEDLREFGAGAKNMAADFDSTQKEKAAMQRRIEESEQRHKALKEENQRLVGDGKEKLERLQGLYLETSKTLKSSQADLNDIRFEKEKLSKQIVQHVGELAAKDKEIESLKKLQAETPKPANERQLDVLERRNRMLIDQLRRQSEQLRQTDKDVLPRTLDALAKSDTSLSVIGIVDRLNADIFQVTAHMADALNFTNPTDSAVLQANGVLDRANATMGKGLVSVLQALSSQPEEFDSVSVQLGLQACIISCCEKIITSWYPGHWNYSDFLAALYLRISTSTPHLATKWRAVTEHQLKRPSDNTVQAEMEEYITKNLIGALEVSGWRKTQSNTKEFFATFRERLAQVARSALRLNVSLGESWEIMVVHPDERFDGNEMEDAYGKEEAQREDRVVCTTDLGLKMAAGSVVLKPKVVLRSILAEETGLDTSCM